MPATKRRSRSASAKLSKECEEPQSAGSVPPACYRSKMKTYQNNELKMSAYINLVSGATKLDDDVDQLDHTYARSSYWRPQNHFMKPCRYLYSTTALLRKSSDGIEDSEISPDSVREESVVPLLNESLVISEHGDSDLEDCQDKEEGSWEENISKIGWSPVQIRILPKVVRLIEEVHMTRLAVKGRANEIILIENAIKSFSSQLSHCLAGVGWDKQILQWLHMLLMKNLTPKQKNDYLILVAMVRKKLPVFVDRMLIPVHTGRSTFNKDADQFPIANLPVCINRVADTLIEEKFKKLPHSPVFLLIPNSVETEKSERFQLIVKQLHQMAEVHVAHFPSVVGIPMGQYLDLLMTEVRTRLAEVISDFSERPIVLVGWMLGAALACLASQLDPECIEAVICLGFPLRTVDFCGDTPDSSLLNINCPILFILGSKSNLASREDIEEARTSMQVQNNLVLLGSCNDHLVMNRKEMDMFGVTQAMIDRSIIVEIYNFVGELLTQPPPSPPMMDLHNPKGAVFVPRQLPTQAKKKTCVTKTKPVLSTKKPFKSPALKVAKTIVGGNGKIRMATVPSAVSVSTNQQRFVQAKDFVSCTSMTPANAAKYMVLLTHNYAANI